MVSEWKFFQLKFKLPAKYAKLNLKLDFDSGSYGERKEPMLSIS
jgi:hypothetical protein